MADVQMRKVRDEIIPDEEAHQNPVIYYPLQVIIRAEVVLKEKRKEIQHHFKFFPGFYTLAAQQFGCVLTLSTENS